MNSDLNSEYISPPEKNEIMEQTQFQGDPVDFFQGCLYTFGIISLKAFWVKILVLYSPALVLIFMTLYMFYFGFHS